MNPDFRDLLRVLSDAGARFLVVVLMKNTEALGRPKDLVDFDLLRRHYRR